MVDIEETAVAGQREGAVENYPPPLRAVILFSSLVGSWVAVVVAGYLLAHFV